jgi:glycosyltransferase involved in cell wall biosynthesis
LLDSPETRESMGIHNRHMVEERHDWSQVVAQLERVLIEAAAGRPLRNGAR